MKKLQLHSLRSQSGDAAGAGDRSLPVAGLANVHEIDSWGTSAHADNRRLQLQPRYCDREVVVDIGLTGRRAVVDHVAVAVEH